MTKLDIRSQMEILDESDNTYLDDELDKYGIMYEWQLSDIWNIEDNGFLCSMLDAMEYMEYMEHPVQKEQGE